MLAFKRMLATLAAAALLLVAVVPVALARDQERGGPPWAYDGADDDDEQEALQAADAPGLLGALRGWYANRPVSRGLAMNMLADRLTESQKQELAPLQGEKLLKRAPLTRMEAVYLVAMFSDMGTRAMIEAFGEKPNGNWQPHKPVTAAQWQTLLEQAFGTGAQPGATRTVEGTVQQVATTPPGLVLLRDHSQAYALATGITVPITYQKQPITLADLGSGDKVRLTVRRSDSAVVAIVLLQRAPVTRTGTIVSLDAAGRSFVLQDATGALAVRFPANVPVRYETLTLGADSLAQGQAGVTVEGTMVAGALHAARITLAAGSPVRLTARFQSATAGGLTVKVGSQVRTFTLAVTVKPVLLGAVQEWSTVSAGDALRLMVAGGAAAEAIVHSRNNVAWQGTATSVNTADRTFTFSVLLPGASTAVTLAGKYQSGTPVYRNSMSVPPEQMIGRPVLALGHFRDGNTLALSQAYILN